MTKNVKKNTLRVLLITNGLVVIASTMVGPLYALFVENFTENVLLIGFTFAVFSLVAAVVTLVSGWVSDKYKITHGLIIAGYIIIGLTFLSYLFVKNIPDLILAQILLGIGWGITDPPFDKEYTRSLEKNKEAGGWAKLESLYYITDGVGAIIGSYIVYISSFAWLFAMMSVICFVSSAVYYFYTRNE